MTGIWKEEPYKAAKIICLCGVAILVLLVINIFIKSPSSEAGSPPPEQTRTLPASLYEITAYCPCELCCGEYADSLTASGELAEGFLVAAPSEIPFGTLLRIPGYNNGDPVPVLDRGGIIKGNRLDVFFQSHQEALNWGRQTLKVERLEKRLDK